MLKKRIIYVLIIVILLITCLCIIINKKQSSNNTLNEQENIEKIEEVKEETGATGNTDIYEVQEDKTTNTEIVTVKANIKYKVAFAGMIKQSKPVFGEIDKIFEENYPKKNGIWIENNSRNKVLEEMNNSNMFNSKYAINKDGYLVIEKENTLNENDKKIKNIINGKKQYIFSISSLCYIVDDITGEILDYSFEDMDKYQTFEYFEDENKKIIFITENKSNQLKENEIIESLLNILE